MPKKTKAAVKEAAKAALDEFVESTWTAEPMESQSVEELAEALRGMVIAAEAAGGRDRPEVVHGREALAKIGKPA